jgi:hypothetical protein
VIKAEEETTLNFGAINGCAFADNARCHFDSNRSGRTRCSWTASGAHPELNSVAAGCWASSTNWLGALLNVHTGLSWESGKPTINYLSRWI